MLEIHQRDQAKFRALLGEGYKVDLDLVIALPDGSPWKPDSFSAAYADFAAKIGLAPHSFPRSAA